MLCCTLRPDYTPPSPLYSLLHSLLSLFVTIEMGCYQPCNIVKRGSSATYEIQRVLFILKAIPLLGIFALEGEIA
ncbi:hypothetical protein BDV37DRAFT_265858 [Aspergillus pseudonomiae]|uniref:Uncharacterized protein n=1 Tax=Aspergillus pseudonomiae TaxID=1506151 RepID=A0A5N7CUQ9_9EURO|nr:uncharacterized protein BDV37DRAFT_265858 [Aspergillus pseudonomiae]KAE8397343.1 hypothetical protein BDV37DRAFT_265858 [Aspergillus pseudonomiae]